MNTTTTALTRDLDEAMLGGVLAGIASRYDWDPTLLRLVAALVAIATGRRVDEPTDLRPGGKLSRWVGEPMRLRR